MFQGGQVPIIDTIKRFEVDTLMANQRELLNNMREFRYAKLTFTECNNYNVVDLNQIPYSTKYKHHFNISTSYAVSELRKYIMY